MLVDLSAPLDEILKRFRPSGFIGSPKAHLLRIKYSSLRGLPLYISTGFIPLWHRRLSSMTAEPIPITDASHPPADIYHRYHRNPQSYGPSAFILLAQHKALAHHMDFAAGDVDMPTLAVFLLHSLAAGATCVLPDANLRNVAEVNAESIIKQIEHHSVTSMSRCPCFQCPVCANAGMGPANRKHQKYSLAGASHGFGYSENATLFPTSPNHHRVWFNRGRTHRHTQRHSPTG